MTGGQEEKLHEVRNNKECHPDETKAVLEPVCVLVVSMIYDSSHSAAVLNLIREQIGVVGDQYTELILINQLNFVVILNAKLSDVEQAKVLIEHQSFVQFCSIVILVVNFFD